jgi:lysophospholipase L1-like esterase
MTTDADIAAIVRKELIALMQQGEPYTSLPLIDPDTYLLPPPVLDAIRAPLEDVSTELEADLGTLTTTVITQGAGLDELDELTTVGRLSEPNLTGTYVPLRGGLGLSAFRNLRPVAYHSGVPGNQGQTSNGTDLGSNARLRHPTTGPVSTVALVYSNWRVQSSGVGETNGANSITVRAAVETVGGAFIPVFFNGKRDVVIEPGATVMSDPASVGNITDGYFFTRTYVLVTSGQTWPLSVTAMNAFFTGEGVANSGSPSDLTTSGSIGTTAGRTFGPVAVLGSGGSENLPIVGLLGDSIGTGTGDTLEDWGAFSRKLSADLVPLVKISAAGETAQNVAQASQFRRKVLIPGCTDIICQLGVNDFRTNRTTENVQADTISVWRASGAGGAKVWQTTVTPTNTTSTDSWATVGNQTIQVPQRNTERVDYNNWVRDGAPLNPSTFAAQAIGATTNTVRAGEAGHPLAGYIEIADAIESARDSGLFKAASTGDGLHPNPSGHVLLAAAIDTSIFDMP